jgi:hypothetical protein
LHRTLTTITVLALCVATTSSFAQSASQVQRFERRVEEIRRQTLLGVNESLTLEQRALFQYGGFTSFHFYAIDDENQNTHILRQTDASAYASLNLDNAHRFFLRGRATNDDFNSGDSFDDEGDSFDTHLDIATWAFDLNHARAAAGDEPGDWNFQSTAGRQLAHWATGLTLSRVVDGASITLADDNLSLHALAGMTVEDSFDFDASRPNFDDDTKRLFIGARLAWQMTPEHRPFIYGMVQRDHNSEDFVNEPLGPSVKALPTFYHYDSFYLAAGSTGNLGDRLLYAVEAVYQGGDSLSDSFYVDGGNNFVSITQTEDDIEAFALDARLDYLFTDANRSRAELEIVLASGDTDRGHTSNTFNGNTPGTTDRAFNGFGLINTGLAFAPAVSNLVMVRGGLSTFPLPNSDIGRRLQIGTNVFVYHKLESHAPIEELTSNDSYLGSEVDLFANWQMASDVSLTLRYGVFFPGDAIVTDNQPRHFLLTGVTYAF